MAFFTEVRGEHFDVDEVVYFARIDGAVNIVFKGGGTIRLIIGRDDAETVVKMLAERLKSINKAL
jgi:hypothetical protein